MVFLVVGPGLAGWSHHVYFDPRSFRPGWLEEVHGGSRGLSPNWGIPWLLWLRTVHSLLFDDNFLNGNGRGGRNVPVRSRNLSVDPFFWFLWSKMWKLLSALPGTDIDWETRPYLDLSSALLADWVLNLISLLTLPSPPIMVFVIWTVPPSPICSCSRLYHQRRQLVYIFMPDCCLIQQN